MTRITLIAAVAAIALAAGGWWYFAQLSAWPENSVPARNDIKGAEPDPRYYAMDVSQDGNRMLVTNTALGFQFSVPGIWRIGDNRLGYGTFQMFNYEEAAATGSKWDAGENKIEMALIDDPATFASGSMTPVKIAGEDAFRTEGEFKNYVSYIVPLKAAPGKFITMTIYGDPKNYTLLDSVVATLSIK